MPKKIPLKNYIKKNRYSLIKVYCKNSEIQDGKKIDIPNKKFKEKKLFQLINSQDEEILNNIELTTDSLTVSLEQFYNIQYVDLNHNLNETFNLTVNGIKIADVRAVNIDGFLAIETEKLVENHEEIIDNLINKFNIIKLNKKLYLAQDNVLLFEIVDNILKKIKGTLYV